MIKEPPSNKIGDTIPNNTYHAVSVSLPTWEATVGYEEGQDWVVSKMNSGYPRFYIHSAIQTLARNIESKYGRKEERCMLFPSYNIAKRCRAFIKEHSVNNPTVRLLQLSTRGPKNQEEQSTIISTDVAIVFFPPNEFTLAKNYWQHSGEGISSRAGEYLLHELFEKNLSEAELEKVNISQLGSSKAEMQAKSIQARSPSIQLKRANQEEAAMESNVYIDQKFGRVLDLKFANEAKTALRRRIAGKVSNDGFGLKDDTERGTAVDENDVYLYSTGMTSIFNAHRALMNVLEAKKSVCFGFPYVDTLNILKKFGPGVHFLGMGDDQSLRELEEKLEKKEIDIMALFCECPSNPLLKTPNLKKLRQLADKYHFAIVVDETVGNFLNIHVLPYADIVVSSLTKIFSGDSNVMGGSLILNFKSAFYQKLKHFFDEDYEDVFWPVDALVLERNSRDFPERSARINETALAAVEVLKNSPLISKLYYPSLSESKKYYDEIKNPDGGYGGLISFLFEDPEDAICFFNSVNLYKGPSLGTNFTLACPYTILAHYQELDEVEEFDVDRNLIRISIGMEEKADLLDILQKSLDITQAQHARRI